MPVLGPHRTPADSRLGVDEGLQASVWEPQTGVLAAEVPRAQQDRSTGSAAPTPEAWGSPHTMPNVVTIADPSTGSAAPTPEAWGSLRTMRNVVTIADPSCGRSELVHADEIVFIYFCLIFF